jgi:hypothetical protein
MTESRGRGGAPAGVAAVLVALALVATTVMIARSWPGVSSSTPGSSSEVLGTPSMPSFPSPGSGSGSAWVSGAWLGPMPDAAKAGDLGSWRGRPLDLVTTYPQYQTWQQLGSTEWTIAVFDGFAGRLSYGLPLLPRQDAGSLADVAAGAHDDTWRSIAALLRKHGRDDASIRIGLEANGDWFPWGIGHQGHNDPAQFVAAYRRVAQVLRAELPRAELGFDIGCAHPMAGQRDRLDSLTALYPGDDVVDVVGCDHYDAGSSVVRDETTWQRVLRPPRGPGLADVLDFAVAHGKGFAVPEWGLTAAAKGGGGDNVLFLTRMHDFFAAHAMHVAYENYFNEPDPYIGCALWQPGGQGRPPGSSAQNPLAAEAYRRLW